MCKYGLRFVVVVGVVMFGLGATAWAVPYGFEDTIDWGGPLWGEYIQQGDPFSYQHDINDEVDIANGDYVIAAELEVGFIWDMDDSQLNLCFVQWDNREYVSYYYAEDGNWYEMGEVDSGSYDLVLNVDWLNDDGLLDVTISVSNPLGTGDVMLDYSSLSGTAEAAPVPEPASMVLLGIGLIGLAGLGRKRRNKF